MSMIVIGLAVVEALGVAGLLFVKGQRNSGGNEGVLESYEAELATKQSLVARFDTVVPNLVESSQIIARLREMILARESLKAERGRVTITQAELETIEVRLRELDEIARELEASALETKEELKILQKKERELTQKNETLKGQIAQSLTDLDQVIGQIEMTAQMQEQIASIKAELTRTDAQIATLFTAIQEGNEQYFILKRRYDALDIEYAQLYEKFSEQQSAG
jgi:chromosome segregation ATPase